MITTSREAISMVRMGEVSVSASADGVLAAYGLGSCVGLIAWDPTVCIGGMAHIVLPSSSILHDNHGHDLMRFADVAVPALVDAMVKQKASKHRLVVCLAGGARVLSLAGSSDGLAIGARNVSATREALAKLGLVVAAEDVGSNRGRTLVLYVGTGRVTVQSTGQGMVELQVSRSRLVVPRSRREGRGGLDW